RLEVNEIEVKATLLNRRIHVIHGLDQLVASSGTPLHILSLQFEYAGTSSYGKTLVERIDGIRTFLGNDRVFLKKFDAHMLNLGFNDCDAPFYTKSLKLRNEPMLIPITPEFPKLTRNLIAQILPL